MSSNSQTQSFQSGYATNTNTFTNQTTSKKSEDGYNWRKYGQKVVKGSENPRSYYKCTYPNCSMKKKLETNMDGQITEIVYKGSHNHPKPQSTRRSSLSTSSLGSNTLQMSSQILSNHEVQDYPDQSYGSQGSGQFNSVATPENSSIPVGDDEFDRSKSRSGGDDLDADEDEPQTKRWRASENEGISMIGGTRTVREPRVVVQTTSDIDILDDGYRWRKYGQKVFNGNPNPRSYYKRTSLGCSVRTINHHLHWKCCKVLEVSNSEDLRMHLSQSTLISNMIQNASFLKPKKSREMTCSWSRCYFKDLLQRRAAFGVEMDVRLEAGMHVLQR